MLRVLRFLRRLIGYGLLFCVVAQIASCVPSYVRMTVAALSL
jgi:hypothetical protein